MAFITNIEETAFGIPVENAYTFITELHIVKHPMFAPPEIEGDPATQISAHYIQFRTESYASKEAKDNGQSPVAGHGYTIPFDYTVNKNILEIAYDWLKANVGIFKNATPV
jgi:hypothetical protein